jgi:hypothetical protein
MPLDLDADPLAAAVRARPPAHAEIVWIHIPERSAWCVLRRADAGGLYRMLCLLEIVAGGVHLQTSSADPTDRRRPHNACPACCTEIAAGTPGAAVATERPTVDLKRPSGEQP